MPEMKSTKNILPWDDKDDDWIKSGHKKFNQQPNPWRDEKAHRDEGDESDHEKKN